MKITKRSIEGIYEITSPFKYVDNRGFLLRIFDNKLFQEQRLQITWLQQSLSYTASKNVVRGLNVQLPPFTEAKLITVLNGEVFWVAVDVRKNSSTFGKWEGLILSQNSINALLVLRGFAHGCLSLTDNCNLLLNTDNYYSQEHNAGIVWDDADLNIGWPLGGALPIVSEAHLVYPDFKSFIARYGGI